MIVGAADRMVTAGDLEYEPPESKIYGFNSSTVAMFAGTVTDHQMIFRATLGRIGQQRASDVKTIADFYANELASLRRQRNEARVLSPIGLTFETFIARQQEMSEHFIDEVFDRLDSPEADVSVDTIIAGIDGHGPNLLIVRDPGIVTDFSATGYAAVGYGSGHALSRFRFDQYNVHWPAAKAMLLAYRAKKFAQAAPGVGTATDMFAVLPNVGLQFIDPPVEGMIMNAYMRGVKAEKRAWDTAYAGISEQLGESIRKAEEAQVRQQAGAAVTTEAGTRGAAPG